MAKFKPRPASLIILTLTSLLASSLSQANSFVVEGSDLLMGIGPSEIARAGASSATTNDIYAVRWNPAGLAENTHHSISLSRQLDSQLTDINFAGFSFHQPNILQSNFDSTIAISWISRLHIKSKGMFEEDGLESVFLEYALPSYPSDFNGKIESKTREYLLAWAIKPAKKASWSFGMSIGLIQCGTSSCGIRASNPDDYHVSSTDATATSIGIGIKYQLSNNIKLAARIKDINTKLKVDTNVSSDGGIEKNSFTTHMPLDLTLGLAANTNGVYVVSCDFQILTGKYGSSKMDFQIFRLGLRRQWQQFEFNAGSIVPIRLHTQSTGNFMRWAPAPFLPTAGLSWQGNKVTFDLGVYPNAIRSFLQKNIALSADAAISVSF